MMAFIHGETRDERKARLLAEGIEDTGPSGTMGDLLRSLGFMPKFTNEISDAITTGFSRNPAESVYKQPIERGTLAAPTPSAPSRDAGGYDALANVRQESPAATTLVGTSSPAGPMPSFPRIPRVNEGLNEAVPQADVDAAEYNRKLAENARGPEHLAREIPALIQGNPNAIADAADKFRDLAMSSPAAVSTAFANLTEQVVATGGDMDQVFTKIWSSPTIQQLAPNLKKLLSNVWNDYKQKQQPGLPPNVVGL